MNDVVMDVVAVCIGKVGKSWWQCSSRLPPRAHMGYVQTTSCSKSAHTAQGQVQLHLCAIFVLASYNCMFTKFELDP